MYLLKIWWFRGISHLLGVEGGPKVKKRQKWQFQNMHILQKIDHNSKILLFVGKIWFHIQILLVILHLIHQKLGPNKGDTYNITIAPKLGTKISKFQFWGLNPTTCIPFDRAHQTEQLLSRHHMVIYYGMRGIEDWMGQTRENDKIFQENRFMQKCMFLKLPLLALFDFETPSSPKQVADPPKPSYF